MLMFMPGHEQSHLSSHVSAQAVCWDAGFFLFAVQPFKLGDKVAVTYATPLSVGGAQPSSWFEGTCEKVDLRCALAEHAQA